MKSFKVHMPRRKNISCFNNLKSTSLDFHKKTYFLCAKISIEKNIFVYQQKHSEQSSSNIIHCMANMIPYCIHANIQ
jgi:CTP:phosphocholine cytidylyltransferase-like protein